MQYISTLSLVFGVASAQMTVMTLMPAPSNGPATHTVVVGGLKPVATGMAPVLGYSPESIVANVGDMVMFEFMQKNHTATQSTFDEPCKAMPGGMDSGFMPNPEGKAGVTWNMTVNTADPLWFYCKQRTGVHCGKGMVFSINAKTIGDRTMTDFKQKAINQNGTAQAPLTSAAIQQVQPGAQAAPSTVTIQAGVAQSTGTASGQNAAASVVPGTGTDSTGAVCSCSCLCGVSSFPQVAAQNSFGGFAGMLP